MCVKYYVGIFILLTALTVMAESIKHNKPNEGKRRHNKHHTQQRNPPQAYVDNLVDERGRAPQEDEEPILGPPEDAGPPDDEAGNGSRDPSPTPESPPLCPVTSCSSDFQMSIDIRLRQIQDQFLKESGLDKPPNMTGVVISQNPHLRSLIYNTNAQESVTPKQKADNLEDMTYGDDPSQNVRNEKVFIPASLERPDFITLPDEDVVVYFNLSKEHISSIEFAYLHLWVRPDDHIHPKDKVATASIYKINVKTYSDFPQLTEFYNGIRIPYKREGSWIKVDIFLLARDWILHPENNFGLTVVLNTADNKLLYFDSAAIDPEHAPLLELDVVEERNARGKRYVNNRICTDKKIEKICCRYPMIVNFVDFQWDFIVAPKRYEANYCRGDCPFVFAQKYPHSTLLQTKFNNTNSTHGPCCGARVLDPLRMVYYDGHKIKVSTIKDMVVKQCSCT